MQKNKNHNTDVMFISNFLYFYYQYQMTTPSGRNMLYIYFLNLNSYKEWAQAAGGAVGWGTALQAGRSLVRFPDGVIGNFLLT